MAGINFSNKTTISLGENMISALAMGTDFWTVSVKNDAEDKYWGEINCFYSADKANASYENCLNNYNFVRLDHFVLKSEIERKNYDE